MKHSKAKLGLNRLQSAIFAGLLMTAGCGGEPPPKTFLHYAIMGSAESVVIERLSADAYYTGAFKVFNETIRAPYDAVFATVIRVLKTNNDPLAQADADAGIIVTSFSPMHGGLYTEYWTQYFILLRRISVNETRIVFKLCSYRWLDDEDHPPSMYAKTPHNFEANHTKAARFIEAVRNSLAAQAKG